MGSIRPRGRSLGSGRGAMFVSYAVSALSVSARLTACLRRCPCSQCRSLHEYVPILSTTEVQQSNASCGDGRVPQGQTCYDSVSRWSPWGCVAGWWVIAPCWCMPCHWFCLGSSHSQLPPTSGCQSLRCQEEVGVWDHSELFVYTANCSCCFLSLAQAELLGCLAPVKVLLLP